MKILIAYDQMLVAECLKIYLAQHGHSEIIGMVDNGENPLEVIADLRPDIIILEFKLWSNEFIDYVSNLNSKFPHLKILVISELISQELMVKIMPFINGYILKSCSAEKIVLAIQEIKSSGKYLCPKAVDKFFSCSGSEQNDSNLTIREKEILGTWVTEETYNAVANTLNISESTVRSHLKNIREKLGSINHLQMMIYACQHNLISDKHKPICPNCRFSLSATVN